MDDGAREVELHEMLDSCAPCIHRHYDGDPALNLGSSGIANILPGHGTERSKQ